MANVYSLFRQRSAAGSDFILSQHRQPLFSYQHLDQASSNYAHRLCESGIGRGDRVMVQVEKSPQCLFLYFACLRVGAVYLPLNTAYQDQELAYFVADAKPALIVCDPARATFFSRLPDTPLLTLDRDGKGSLNDPDPPDTPFDTVNVQDDEIAVIVYTSGTTGRPKGAMITHDNLATNALTLHQAWQWQAGDVMLHALPLFHIHGLFVATHPAVLNASPIIFLTAFDPDQVIECLPHATVYMGVPTHYVRLLATGKIDREVCRNMRLFTSGSAPLQPQVFAEFSARTGHEILERYGMTETGMITSNPVSGPRKPGMVGLPLPGCKMQIIDANGSLPIPTEDSPHTPGDGSPHTPGDGSPCTPGDSSLRMPGDGSPRMPIGGSPHTPGDGSPHTPGDGSPHTPGDGSPRTPGDGSPRMPTGDSPRTPGDGSPRMPTGGSPRMPTGDSPRTPGDGSPRMPTGGSPHTPGDGSPRMPTGGSPRMPTGDSPHTPGDGSPCTPTGDSPHTPGDGSPCTPGDSSLRMPGDDSPHAPGDSPPRTPGDGSPRTPGDGSPRTPAEGLPLAPGKTGQLLVKGSNVFKGYWQMPEKTAEAFTDDGYFRTGDLARIDADGYLSIVGRNKDMIISGGLNIYPIEIEIEINKLDGVVESAVIGLPHPDFGESVCAVVVPGPGANLTETQIIEQVKAQLANFKTPKWVYFVDALPRNAMGKVQKNLLRDKLQH